MRPNTSTLRSVGLGLGNLGLGLALIGAVGCDSFQGKWEAFVYPRSNRGRAVYVNKFKTLAHCRAAALGSRLGSLRSTICAAC